MYEERERFSFKDVVLQIVLVVLFVFLLLWLFPTKSYVDKSLENGLNPLYNQLFSQNINTMKEAAISYFTTSRLPKNIGDKVSLTLGDMLDKKLLIPFLDSNNKQCNLTESYVEITKMDDEYILKVNLDCSDNSDYILVHLGCYSYCESGLCEKQEKPVQPVTKPSKPVVKPTVTKKYEYEYELVTDGKWGDWSNWSEWSTIKVDKTDYRNVKTKEETVVTDTETIKVGTITKVTDAKETVSRYCPKGYTLKGTECTRQVTTTDVKEATKVTNTAYNCNAYPGYTLDGTQCKKTITTSSVDVKEATKVTNSSCPSGYTPGDVCKKEVTYISSYKQGGYITTVYNANEVPRDNNSYFYDEVGADYVFDCANGCGMKWVYTYNVYASVPVYKTKIEEVEATITTSYNCNVYPGYTLEGTQCKKTITTSSVDVKDATAITTETYNCDVYPGYTLNGTQCSKPITKKQTIKASTNVKYSCNTGDLVGKICVTYEDKYETFNIYSTITYYSYQTREFISGDRKLVWSTSQKDQELINLGYNLTGNVNEI